MVEVHNLKKIFSDKKGDVVAVNNLSFSCNKGEIFGILGPNGAGKTTLLRMLSTIIQPTSGSATINGYDTQKDSKQVRSQIGFLSGNTGLYARLSALEMIQYFGRLYGMNDSEIKSRIEAISQMLNMKDILGRRCSKLSTGEKQKVSIARTIIHNPPVLILDEPTLGLDIITSRSIVNFIKQSKDEGKTILLSTHYMDEAERLCDRILLLHKGKELAIGTLSELKNLASKENLGDVFLNLVERETIL